MAASKQPATAMPARVRTPLWPKIANEFSSKIPTSVLTTSMLDRVSNPNPRYTHALRVRLRFSVLRISFMF